MCLKIVNFENIFAIMLPICVRPERVWHKLSSIQGIRANLVYIVSLPGKKLEQMVLLLRAKVKMFTAMKNLLLKIESQR